MLNTTEFYRDLGTKVAEAHNHRDGACADFHRNHFRRALALEKDDDKLLASQVYEEAFRAARNTPRVEYFR